MQIIGTICKLLLRSAGFAQELLLIGDTGNNTVSPVWGAWLLGLPHLLPLLHSLLSPLIFCNSVTIRVNKRCVCDPIKQFASSSFVMKFSQEKKSSNILPSLRLPWHYTKKPEALNFHKRDLITAAHITVQKYV